MCSPWLKFSRAMSIPVSISARTVLSVATAGPRVQTIFALRGENRAPGPAGSRVANWRERCSVTVMKFLQKECGTGVGGAIEGDGYRTARVSGIRKATPLMKTACAAWADIQGRASTIGGRFRPPMVPPSMLSYPFQYLGMPLTLGEFEVQPPPKQHRQLWAGILPAGGRAPENDGNTEVTVDHLYKIGGSTD